MSTRTFGILAGVVGSAVGAWWWARQRMHARTAGNLTPARDHGALIYDNTPHATEGSTI